MGPNQSIEITWLNERTRGTAEKIPKTDKVEFCVRFACGGLFGVFVSLYLVMSVMPDSAVAHLPLLALGVLGVVLAPALPPLDMETSSGIRFFGIGGFGHEWANRIVRNSLRNARLRLG